MGLRVCLHTFVTDIIGVWDCLDCFVIRELNYIVRGLFLFLHNFINISEQVNINENIFC